MRKAMERQQRFGCQPISEVQLNVNCRDEIIPILAALQHIYCQPKLRDELLRAVAADVNGKTSRKRGRKGLDYWPITVLAAVRLGCNFDYDKLQDLAEQHGALRQIMGIGGWGDDNDSKKSLDWRRIRDNIALIRPQTLECINHLIVAEGHRLVPEAVKSTRADSFVVETNIHYPTESSLIRDGLRKVIDCAVFLASLLGVAGWRQHKQLYRKVKRLVRETDRIAARKGAGYQERIKSRYVELLALADTLLARADDLQNQCARNGGVDLNVLAAAVELKTFVQRTRHVCGTATRRVINGEIVVEQTRKLQQRLGGRIERASFDRGFHSPQNQTELAKIITCPCLPKPGASQAAEQEKQAPLQFRQARQSHPGVESAINALECGNGLQRCRDRTETGFERYLQLAVLGRNLHVLGKLLLSRSNVGCNASRSQRKKVAA